ncbi:MAG TPA: hypothetical protein VLB07_01570 [Woeseiaceae bacterium]|nr:hypothetical protein [Woeseiaceae bacterium]
MAERLKDGEDLRLEAMFQSAPIADDGFSNRVVSRIRRQIWVQRLSLPIAFVVGAAFAARPLAQLVETVSGLLKFIPQTVAGNVGTLPVAGLPQLPVLVLGSALLVAALLFGRLAQK